MIKANDLNKAISRISGELNQAEARHLISEVLEGMRDVALGFVRIGIAAGKIKEKKYYKEMGYPTFEDLCQDIFKLTRKTVNLYLRIVHVKEKYPVIFTDDRIAVLGTAKMEKIISGVLKIENMAISDNKKIKTIENIVSESIENVLSVSEVFQLVKQQVESL